MVVAGIYLIARTYFIFQLSPIALGAVAWVGLLTAFFAATMAIVTYDIKRVLAFSTISQLGYMMLGLGVGGYTSALFHLTTHAFFKALLFLGAGSVIHAVHTNDMREMGGLSSKMPATFVTMVAATAAISGFPYLFSGWWSKEAILHDVYAYSPAMWAVGVLTAGLTCFYMCRLMWLTFLGQARDQHKWDHAHESPFVMTLPLWLLAILSVFAGGLLHFNGVFKSLVHHEVVASHGQVPGWTIAAAIIVFFVGGFAAYHLYGSGDFKKAKSLRERFSPAVSILDKRYYFDHFFLWLVKLSDQLAAMLFWIDANIIDKILIDGWALVMRAMAELQNFIDMFFVDGAVDGFGTITQDAGWGLRKLVRGQVQEYLLYIALAMGLFSVFLITR